MFLHVASEEGQVGEVQFDADFLDALGGVFQEVFNVFRHIEVDELRGGLPAAILAGGGQVFGGDAEGFRVIAQRAGFGMQRGQQFDELLEECLPGRERAPVILRPAADEVGQIATEGGQEGIPFLSPEERDSALLAGQQVKVFAELLHFSGRQVQQRQPVYQQFDFPMVALRGQNTPQVARRDADVQALEIRGLFDICQDGLGRTSQQVTS